MLGRLRWKRRPRSFGLRFSDPVSKRLQQQYDEQFHRLVAETTSAAPDASQPPLSERIKALDGLAQLIQKHKVRRFQRLESFALPGLIVVIATLVAVLVYVRAGTAEVEITTRVKSLGFTTTKQTLAFQPFPLESVTLAGKFAGRPGSPPCESLEITKPADGGYLLFDSVDLPADTIVEMSLIAEDSVQLRLHPERPADLALSLTYPPGSTLSGCIEATPAVSRRYEAQLLQGELTAVLKGLTRSALQRLDTAIPIKEVQFFRRYEWQPGNVQRLSSIESGEIYFEKLTDGPLTLREGQLLVAAPKDPSAIELIRVESGSFRVRIRGAVSRLDVQAGEELRSRMPSLLSTYMGRRDWTLIYSGTAAAVALLLSARRALIR